VHNIRAAREIIAPTHAARRAEMTTDSRLRALRVVLRVVGVISIVGIYPLTVLWPSGWTWGQGHSHYLMMILGIYATLGVFLLMAARDPLRHASLIWFTVWSSVVHALIMAGQAMTDAGERGHLLGDVPVLLLIAVVLGGLMPRGAPARA
jgi:hypothetical protein